MGKLFKMTIVVLFLVVAVGQANADEITDSIKEALEAYAEKAYAETVDSLGYALQLINQLRSDLIKGFLPKPLDGWKAEEGKAQAGAGFLGGSMIGASRVYRDKRKQVKIDINDAASPMMQGMMTMFSNPAFATAGGGKWQKIKRQKAIVKYNQDNRNGEITMVVDNKYVVKLEGSNLDKEDMIAYAEAIDYKGLKKL